MLSVVIPTWQAEGSLGATLDALSEAPAGTEIVVTDGGSTDATRAVAERAGCRVVSSPKGRGAQLAAGARAARGDWLMFLHADTVPSAGWTGEVTAFIGKPGNEDRAAVFGFALDDDAVAARLVEWSVGWRCRLVALPYGDQGLVIHRDTYEAIGGFRPMAIFEDVDIVRRLGRRRLHFLAARAVTSAARYRRDGYFLRPARNLFCLALYFFGLPPATIRRIYR
jgi:rSAM/selenodomain-associated transferase 2